MFKNMYSKKIPLLLLNARITKKTFNRWLKFKNFTKSILENIKIAYPQNKETKSYLKKLDLKNYSEIGNIKFAEYDDANQNLDRKLNLELKNKKFWIASSTHNSEEIFCANAHKELKKKNKNLITIIIPRHVHRAKEIALEMKKLNLGSGDKRMSGFLNLDKFDTFKPDIVHDLEIFPLIKKNKKILIVAHGNSLRALLVYLGKHTKESIVDFEFKTCEDYNIVPDHSYYYARQILDSRGFPTIEVKYMENNKVLGRGSSPSGASCGSNEALELRDNIKGYMKGKSVLTTVEKINNEINDYLHKFNIKELEINVFDELLKKYDESEQKINIGGNTTTALSFCMADVYSKQKNMELYEYFSYIYNNNCGNYDSCFIWYNGFSKSTWTKMSRRSNEN